MFERFTEPARAAMVVTNAEARRHGHDFMDTSHLLLGILGPDDATPRPATAMLGTLGVDPQTLRQQIESTLDPASPSTSEHLRFTPDARRALEGALREAMAAGSWGIGPEHLLLGLLRVEDRPAAQWLAAAGVTLALARPLAPVLPRPPRARRWPFRRPPS